MSTDAKSRFSDAGKGFLLRRMPWIIRWLPGLRGTKFDIQFTRDRIIVADATSRREIWLSRANAVYVPDMVKSFDYYFDAVAPFRQPATLGGQWVVDYSTPRIHCVSGFADFPVHCPSLVEPYQTCEQYLQFGQLTEGQNVFDLGCYSGLTAIAFSKAVGRSGRVVSVEPDPVNFSASEKNLELHSRLGQLDNVTLLPVAVAGHSGTLTFSAEGSMGSSAVSVVGGYRGEVVDIPCVTLDGLLEQSGLERVHFIKMDIEGSESGVLQTSAAFFQTQRPRLIIEPHVVDGKLNADQVMACLSSYGYRCEVIEQWGVALPLVTAVPLEHR